MTEEPVRVDWSIMRDIHIRCVAEHQIGYHTELDTMIAVIPPKSHSAILLRVRHPFYVTWEAIAHMKESGDDYIWEYNFRSAIEWYHDTYVKAAKERSITLPELDHHQPYNQIGSKTYWIAEIIRVADVLKRTNYDAIKKGKWLYPSNQIDRIKNWLKTQEERKKNPRHQVLVRTIEAVYRDKQCPPHDGGSITVGVIDEQEPSI